MRLIALLVLIAFGFLLLYASTYLPLRGDFAAPAHRSISSANSTVASDYYVRNSMKDSNTPNIVTTVLADYRSFDTLGEVIVVLTAGLCCSLILRREKS